MGLDQYAFSVRAVPQKTFDFINQEHEESSKDVFVEWRKHNRLQGYMESLWESKGRPGLSIEKEGQGMGSDFNCIDILLTMEDLDELERVIDTKSLPETEGFFFGGDSFAELDDNGRPYGKNDYYYKSRDLEFVKEARKRIADGHKVFYGCWW